MLPATSAKKRKTRKKKKSLPKSQAPPENVQKPRETDPGPDRAFVYTLPVILIFISGFCSLLYEVVWGRMLVLVMGNTTLATSTILASFMAGLSLGGYFWGRYIETHPHWPLVVFGGLELGVGLFALVFIPLIGLAAPLDVRLSNIMLWGGAPRIPLRFFFCFFLLLFPTFLMGGTLAVLGQHVIERKHKFGRYAAVLYGVNTAGAVLGAFLAGFFLIKFLGHRGAIYLAAVANAGVGLSAVLAGFRLSREREAQPPRKRKQLYSVLRQPSRFVFFAVLTATTISGFCTLGYEVIWTRLLVLVVDNSVYSFTIILISILIGLALGSLSAAPFFRNLKNPVLIFALVEIGIATLAFIFPFFIEPAPVNPDDRYWVFLLVKLPLIILAPAILMGATFPLAADVIAARRDKVGGSLGIVYALGTLGGVAGAMAAGFFLIPVLGFHTSALLLPALNLTAAIVLLAACLKRLPAFIAALAIILSAGLVQSLMPSDFFAQKYARLEPGSSLIYYHEGRAATVSIFERPDANRVLYLNGIPELDTSKLSVATFRLMGALPGLLHGHPSSALMVTFGAGVTAGAAAPFVERLDCVDLVEQYKDIGRYFAPANNRVTENKKFTMHVDDARHYLQTTKQRYSIIVSDATHPRSYDSWVLFTKEFYRLVQTRLEPGGVFCQWAPYHGLGPTQFEAIIKTFSDAFPHTSVWGVGGAYSLLVATPEPLSIDFEAMQKSLSDVRVRRLLRSVELNSPFAILSHFMMGEDRVKAVAAKATRIITDNSPAHLFFSPSATLKEQYEIWPRLNYENLRGRAESVIPYLTNVGRTDVERERILDVIRTFERRRGR